MLELEQIYALIVASAPALTAIIGIIFAVVKGIKTSKSTSKDVINKFEEVRQEIFNTKEYEELKSQLVLVNQENLELKKKINELLTKIDRIQRKEGE